MYAFYHAAVSVRHIGACRMLRLELRRYPKRICLLELLL